MNKTVAAISPQNMDSLTHYSWPGNIRELQNVIERSVVVYRKGNLSVRKSRFSGQPLHCSSARQSFRRSAIEDRRMIDSALAEAHCAAISFGPSRYSPSRLPPSAVSFTVATGLLPGGKNPCTRHTLVPRSGRLNGQPLNGPSGELPGGAVEQKLGTLPDDGCAPGGLSDCTLCTNLIRRYYSEKALVPTLSSKQERDVRECPLRHLTPHLSSHPANIPEHKSLRHKL
jgi:hypothetical protein